MLSSTPPRAILPHGGPKCINYALNIFQFPELSLSAGSEASVVTRQWDTALNTNAMTSCADAEALMKQQRALPIVRWEVAAKMLDQWMVVTTTLIGPQECHPAVFEMATLLKAVEEVNSCLRTKAEVQKDILEALVRLVHTKFNESF